MPDPIAYHPQGFAKPAFRFSCAHLFSVGAREPSSYAGFEKLQQADPRTVCADELAHSARATPNLLIDRAHHMTRCSQALINDPAPTPESPFRSLSIEAKVSMLPPASSLSENDHFDEPRARRS